MNRKILIETLSSLFILLFVYAAFSKLLNYQKFVIQIGQSPVLTGLGNFVPWMVILSELFISVMLMIPRLRLVGFLAAFSIMAMFTVYILVILNFSQYVPCSCGGILERFGWTEHLVFNSVFILFGLVGIIKQDEERKEPLLKGAEWNT